MKISLAFRLAVLVITVTQLCATKNGNKEIKTENGTDILVTEPELMEIVVSKNNLTFEICTMKCFTDFLVCYEPDPPGQTATDFLTICDNTCGFYVTGDIKFNEDNDTVCYMDITQQTGKTEECDNATMSFKEFEFRFKGNPRPSCKPKIENGLVKLNVTRASSDCPITIKNAQFKRDPPTTTLLPSNKDTSKSNSSLPNSPSGNSSSNVFGCVLIIFCVLHQ